MSDINQKINDIEVLEKLKNKEIDLHSISKDTKKRLIELCNEREKQIREKIKIKDAEIKCLDNILLVVSQKV